MALAVLGSALALGGCTDAGDFSSLESDPSSGADTNFEPALARGISIEEIEVNQGTRIPIGFGGEWVEANERLGKLIASRDSLMRVHYVVADDWVPREIEARLLLGLPDGTSRSLAQTKRVEGRSAPAPLEGTFWFELGADAGETAPGTTYQVELWEAERSGAGLGAGQAANPAEGPRLIGFEDLALEIKLVLVPIEYAGVTPALSAAVQAQLIDSLYEQNPTTAIRWEVHAPLVQATNLNSLSALLPVLSKLRQEEDAAPNVYYHGLIDIGASALGGVYGVSYVASDEKADGDNRVSATVLWSVNPKLGIETFVHEAGHAQGLAHVECPDARAGGGAADPDLSYPHAEGRIGNWGFGVRAQLSYDPKQAFDYMSYCGPTWVSDWTWNKTYEQIKSLSAWDLEGPAGPGEGLELLLMGALYRDGSREWWTASGAVEAERISGRDRFEFETLEGQRLEGWGELATLSDGETQWVKVALPRAPAELRNITHLRAERLESIDPQALVGGR